MTRPVGRITRCSEPHGSSRVDPGVFGNLTGRIGSGHPDTIRPAGSDPTREQPRFLVAVQLETPPLWLRVPVYDAGIASPSPDPFNQCPRGGLRLVHKCSSAVVPNKMQGLLFASVYPVVSPAVFFFFFCSCCHYSARALCRTQLTVEGWHFFSFQ